jgi:hypothetical protein
MRDLSQSRVLAAKIQVMLGSLRKLYSSKHADTAVVCERKFKRYDTKKLFYRRL